jgi:biopolymer transport protein TolR
MEIGDSKSLKSDINVTPLVDVMLVMLIIFMLVTPLLQTGVGVTLPKAKNVAAVPDDESQVVVVALRANGETFLGKDVIDRTQLVSALKQRHRTNPGLQMQIKADKSVHFGDIKKIVQAGREAGFDGAALIAEEEKETSSTAQGG